MYASADIASLATARVGGAGATPGGDGGDGGRDGGEGGGGEGGGGDGAGMISMATVGGETTVTATPMSLDRSDAGRLSSCDVLVAADAEGNTIRTSITTLAALIDRMTSAIRGRMERRPASNEDESKLLMSPATSKLTLTTCA